MSEEYSEAILVDKDTVLKISRVPRDVKKGFVEFANQHFESDYGMLLKWLWDQALEYQQVKLSLFKGDFSQKEQVEENREPVRKKMLSGENRTERREK